MEELILNYVLAAIKSLAFNGKSVSKRANVFVHIFSLHFEQDIMVLQYDQEYVVPTITYEHIMSKDSHQYVRSKIKTYFCLKKWNTGEKEELNGRAEKSFQGKKFV